MSRVAHIDGSLRMMLMSSQITAYELVVQLLTQDDPESLLHMSTRSVNSCADCSSHMWEGVCNKHSMEHSLLA